MKGDLRIIDAEFTVVGEAPPARDAVQELSERIGNGLAWVVCVAGSAWLYPKLHALVDRVVGGWLGW